MSIRLPMLFGSTPDSIKSTDYEDEDSNTVKKYIWKFRNQDRNGVDLIIYPYKENESDNLIWNLDIFEMKWDGEDHKKSNKPVVSNTKTAFRNIIKCAENALEKIKSNKIKSDMSLRNIS